ncbi:FtsX-like permease family protein [Mucilaginibacter sabulilitoris]|uniref:FtsX-like permease family protein n=1 Tax=Mucilaginibacter sabulilitoris TaxID=1173583 RepID=A0ABZ0TCY9_9SPHI|nr:ABC transporter permease [Mucilaginibacter sabulilitoris]WPU91076.1 FtsX-like permease family protein [Mucilaginibacter sabulilitoris]
MIKNYFKIAWRSLVKNKLYSAINIGGLGVGMAVSFMLLIYVYNEFAFDGFHQKKDRIYKVLRNQPANGEIYTGDATPVPAAPAIIKDYPEVETAVRATWGYDQLFNYNNKPLKFNLMAADESFLDMFTFDFVKGNKHDAFKDLASVIMTESAVKALFGDTDPIGKMVKLNGKDLVKVTAVIKDMPENSTFRSKAIISWKFNESVQPWLKTSGWGNYSFATYVLLKPGANVDKLNREMKKLITRYDVKNKENELFLYPFTRWHLYSEFKNGVNTGGSIEYVRLFLFLAVGILLIACINFMNLSTARSERRSREVGIRKVVGARRVAIVQQFLSESILTAFLAFLLAVILMRVLMPYFNEIIGKQMIVPLANQWTWITAIMVILITGILAGSYPALFLSSFKPVKVLKGANNTGKKTLHTRQILVVLQFIFATCLILSSILIYKQIDYIKNRPVGYAQNGLIELDLEGNMIKEFDNFRRDIINSGAVVDAATSSGSIANNNSSTWGVTWPGQLAGEDKIPIDQIATSYHFVPTFGLNILAGRDFEEGRPADTAAVILNEAAVKMMHLKAPLGQIVKWQGTSCAVIGVVKNFVWGSPYEPVKPVIIGFNKGWANAIGVRLNPKAPVSKSLATVEAIYKKYNPEYPFQYKFVDETFGEKFKTEKLLGTLSSSFTVLAIVISCLGLFGLASFSAEQRKKEISIRKVLGASISNLWFNLSKEFLILVVISFVIGSAISWYYMNNWLGHYTYRTNMSLWVFAATIGVSVVVCLLTVSWQAIKAALSNPVKNLRSE